MVTNEGPAVHVWNLRAIRRYLRSRDLDWDAPAFPDGDPADPSARPLPPLQVELDPLESHLDQQQSQSPQSSIESCTARIREDSSDAEAYHHRAHALIRLERHGEAIDDLSRAIGLRPADAHLRFVRGAVSEFLDQYEPAIADLEAALARDAEGSEIRDRLARSSNNRAWELATGVESTRDPDRAVHLGRRAVELNPAESWFLNTLGVARYRAGRYIEAIEALARSRAAGNSGLGGFDLFFLAMAHHRLGHREETRGLYDRARIWLEEQKVLPGTYAKELAAFRAEAEAVLTCPTGELLDDVFVPGRPGQWSRP